MIKSIKRLAKNKKSSKTLATTKVAEQKIQGIL